MTVPRRDFQRPQGERRYRKLFIVAVEGQKTEPQYFALLNAGSTVVRVKCIEGNSRSAPSQVLNRLRLALRNENLRPEDEAWVVVDRDSWTDSHLQALVGFTRERDNNCIALSNPKFEYWLLLHFEDGSGVSNSRDCSARLRAHLSDYSKEICGRKFSAANIRQAVARARRRDTPPCSLWPTETGSTVYRLVERILAAAEE